MRLIDEAPTVANQNAGSHICYNCGAVIRGDDFYCWRCGRRVRFDEVEEGRT